jgi:nitronate monooxygenase
MLTTRFTELVGCSVPIQQAGMAGLSPPRLAAAVAEAGGLGTASVYGATPADIAALLDTVRAQTAGAFGANFIMRFVDPALAHESIAVAADRANVVEFFYSDPDAALVEIVHAGGALACWQVGSREEAVAAAAAGCDIIVAQGIEAGGHVRGQIGLLALLTEVLEAVDVPVLAAGGIGTGRAMAAALAAGADGVRVGTRFVAAEEAGAHPAYVQALIAAEAQDTAYTDVFSVGWPNGTAPLSAFICRGGPSLPGRGRRRRAGSIHRQTVPHPPFPVRHHHRDGQRSDRRYVSVGRGVGRGCQAAAAGGRDCPQTRGRCGATLAAVELGRLT